MPQGKIPGVYVKTVKMSLRSINARPTGICAFVGAAPQGPAGKPVRVDSTADYVNTFGDVRDQNDHMGLAIYAYFAAGGKSALVCRLAPAEKRSAANLSGTDYDAFYAKPSRRFLDAGAIVLPGQQWQESPAGSGRFGNDSVVATLRFCERHRSALVLLDLPVGLELTDAASVARLALPSSPFAALYYPWLDIASPQPEQRNTVRVPPAPTVAGVWARIDSARGVWKAPAGVDATLPGIKSAAFSVTDSQQDVLNPLGVNCIREFRGRGLVVWGARTLATRTDPEWRYINVRRLAIHVQQSVSAGTDWAVFEPNAEPLWRSLRETIVGFMTELYRAGAFAGVSADDTFYVRCGLGQTMTQTDIDSGRLVVEIGFAPVRPAEFVVLRVVHDMRRA